MSVTLFSRHQSRLTCRSSVAALMLAVAILPCVMRPAQAAQPPSRPNIVVIFCDDLGYGDVGPFGSPIATPQLQRMADEGRIFTDFYAAQAVCSASRVALLTGCYANRVGILGALGPGSKIGINPEETTLAELLKAEGYATALFGKWHLGDAAAFYPSRHGFDVYFGLPYSNDMWPRHPEAKFPPLPLWSGDAQQHRVEIAAVTPEDQAQLTTWYTEHAVRFIDGHAAEPFFLYLPHSMPHVPLYVSEKFAGKSGHGLFGDVIQEIDWSVGQILEAIRRNRLEEKTLVVFTSDNGPWLSYGNHAGSAGPLREGKGTAFDGGQREPAIFWWPQTIPAGTVCTEPAATIDLLPTVAALTGAALPPQAIDGADISPLLLDVPGAKPPRDVFYFYWGDALHAVRQGPWKLHFPHPYRTLAGRPGGKDGTPVPYSQTTIGLSLFNLTDDPGETRNLAGEQPEVVARLSELAAAMRNELGDSLTGTKSTAARPAGRP